MSETDLREQLVRHARQMRAEGLVSGTSGNLSVRVPERDLCLVTPSGVDYLSMRPEDTVLVDLNGNIVEGRLTPSVDTMNHVAIYRSRPDVGAVIHTHSPHATAFSVVGRDIPALLTEAAGFLGGRVRVMEYLPPASPLLGERAAVGLGPDRAILLPNHGVIAVGENLRKAMTAASLVEESAQVAFLVSQLGESRPLPAGEVDRMSQFIHHQYGQRLTAQEAEEEGTMTTGPVDNVSLSPGLAGLRYEITQISLVVRDLDKTMKTYHELLGWGPWDVFDHKPPMHHDTELRGKKVHYSLRGAETMVGSMNFELLQPVEGPSLWKEFLDKKGEGIASIAVMFKTREESEKAKAAFAQRGIGVSMLARIGDHIEYYYLDTEPMLKCMIESGSGHAIDFVKPAYVYP